MDTMSKNSVIEFLHQEAERLRKQLKEVEDASQTLEKILSDNNHQTSFDPTIVAEKTQSVRASKRYKIPTSYKKDDTYSDKILFALNDLGEASTRELEEYIIKQEPKLNPRAIHVNVAKNCTRLWKQEKVIMEKAGNSNIYRLA